MSAEAGQLAQAAAAHGVPLWTVGGVGVWQHLDGRERSLYSQVRPKPADLDLLAPRGVSNTLQTIFAAEGYTSDERLISWHGDRRHRYVKLLDPTSEDSGLEVDVFLGSPPSCHELYLEVSSRPSESISPADLTNLMLQKLQIVEPNLKDLIDLAFLFSVEHRKTGTLDTERIALLLSRDWGFWYTATRNLASCREAVKTSVPAIAAETEISVERLSIKVEAAPKSRKWRARSRLGTRVLWYDEVDEVDR